MHAYFCGHLIFQKRSDDCDQLQGIAQFYDVTACGAIMSCVQLQGIAQFYNVLY